MWLPSQTTPFVFASEAFVLVNHFLNLILPGLRFYLSMANRFLNHNKLHAINDLMKFDWAMNLVSPDFDMQQIDDRFEKNDRF